MTDVTLYISDDDGTSYTSFDAHEILEKYEVEKDVYTLNDFSIQETIYAKYKVYECNLEYITETQRDFLFSLFRSNQIKIKINTDPTEIDVLVKSMSVSQVKSKIIFKKKTKES